MSHSFGDAVHGGPLSPGLGGYPGGGSNGYDDSSSFPPMRSVTSFGADDHFRTSYIPDSLMDGYLEHYEEILGDLLTPRSSELDGGIYDGDRSFAEHAWSRLSEVLGGPEDISDSESVPSIDGYFGFGDGDDGENISENRDEGRTDWEHLRWSLPTLPPAWVEFYADYFHHSPETITALEGERAAQKSGNSPMGSPRSPRPRRGSSGSQSPALRPVMPVDLDYDTSEAIKDDSEEDGLGPIPAAPHTGPAVDEVEAIFGS
jgi:hypothetical protein